ncbi:MAG: nitroreductase family protein [Bryobacterales bacterium]|nr:nitroreductase family protein [Bryobacterales bacterium]
MDAIETLKTRRSIRAFTRQPVSRQVIEDVIDCARLAPSAINIQPWEFVAVTQPEMLRAIGESTDHGRFIADAALCVAVLCRETKYYLEDGSAATCALLLALHAHGLGGCWVAGDKKPYGPAICRLLGAPPEFRLISLVAAGYPAEAPVKEKRSLMDVLHWEKF